MIRAFILEWLKIKNHKIFWVILGLCLIVQFFITNGGVFLLEWLKTQAVNFKGLDPSIIPIYDFPDIWQNTTWLGSFIKILLGFIIIISINNDLMYNTLRQNIIDGISKKEFILSKLILIVFLAALCTLLLFFSGLTTGLIYSKVTEVKFIFDELEFVLAYFVQLCVFGTLALTIGFIIKKAGFAITFLFLYSHFFEPITTSILKYHPGLQEHTAYWVQFFPVYAINNLIDVPFQRYIFLEINDSIFWYEWLICLTWSAIYILITAYLLNKKDLKV